MKFNRINFEEWDRKECFNHFMNIAKSTYSITVNVDITELMSFIDKHNLRLYPTFTWIVAKAINNHQEFKMSFDEEGNVGYYDYVCPDYSVLNEKSKIMDTLCTEYSDNFKKFYSDMVEDLAAYKDKGVKTEPKMNFFIASCIPWIAYTSFNASNESGQQFLFPMVTWGKYFKEKNRILMPLTIQINHAAADGYHCSLFYNDVEEIINRFDKYLI